MQSPSICATSCLLFSRFIACCPTRLSPLYIFKGYFDQLGVFVRARWTKIKFEEQRVLDVFLLIMGTLTLVLSFNSWYFILFVIRNLWNCKTGVFNCLPSRVSTKPQCTYGRNMHPCLLLLIILSKFEFKIVCDVENCVYVVEQK